MATTATERQIMTATRVTGRVSNLKPPFSNVAVGCGDLDVGEGECVTLLTSTDFDASTLSLFSGPATHHIRRKGLLTKLISVFNVCVIMAQC